MGKTQAIKLRWISGHFDSTPKFFLRKSKGMHYNKREDNPRYWNSIINSRYYPTQFLYDSYNCDWRKGVVYDFEMGEIMKEKELTKEQIVDAIARIAFNEEAGENINAAIRLRALDMLAKWAGLYEKDNAQKLANTSLLQIAFVSNEVQEQKEKELKILETIETTSVPTPQLEKKEKEITARILSGGKSKKN